VWESGELKLENLIYCYEADKEIERILETEHAVAGGFKNASGVETSPFHNLVNLHSAYRA
jgi:hypothetical protein